MGLAEVQAATPGPAAFERACVSLWLRRQDGIPEDDEDAAVLAVLASWPAEVRILHDATAWNLIEHPAAWSSLVYGLTFFAWGPWHERWTHLAGCTHLTGLRALEAHRGGLDDAGCAALGASPVFAQLDHLVLTNVSLTPERAKLLAQGMPAVRWLDVGHNPIDDAGLAAVLGPSRQTLTHLDVASARVRTLSALKAPLPRLRSVLAHSNNLSAEAVEHLAQQPALETADLGVSLRGDAAAHALARSGARPIQWRLSWLLEVTPDGLAALLGCGNSSLHAEASALLSDLTVRQLKGMAATRGMTGISRLRKAALIARLTSG